MYYTQSLGRHYNVRCNGGGEIYPSFDKVKGVLQTPNYYVIAAQLNPRLTWSTHCRWPFILLSLEFGFCHGCCCQRFEYSMDCPLSHFLARWWCPSYWRCVNTIFIYFCNVLMSFRWRAWSTVLRSQRWVPSSGAHGISSSILGIYVFYAKCSNPRTDHRLPKTPNLYHHLLISTFAHPW